MITDATTSFTSPEEHRTPPAQGPMRVDVRLFARLREAAGTGNVSVLVPPGSRMRDVLAAVPGVVAETDRVRPARNQELCEWDDEVRPGDEVAFIPPVSGGAVREPLVELTREPLDSRRLEAAVSHAGAGAICTFTGIVRDSSQGKSVSKLEYEAYAGMAEREMTLIAVEITQRWSGTRVAMAHRFGSLAVGEASVVVSVSAAHRNEAFEACHWGIDRLKESVPIWKKEFAEDGSYWVEGAQPG